MRRLALVVGLFSIAMATTACATSFTGSAHVENGRSGCELKCRGQGMELVGMVYMGEYSDACVCAVPGQSARLDRSLVAAAGGVASGAAGVVMQMRQQQQQQYTY